MTNVEETTSDNRDVGSETSVTGEAETAEEATTKADSSTDGEAKPLSDPDTASDKATASDDPNTETNTNTNTDLDTAPDGTDMGRATVDHIEADPEDDQAIVAEGAPAPTEETPDGTGLAQAEVAAPELVKQQRQYWLDSFGIAGARVRGSLVFWLSVAALGLLCYRAVTMLMGT